MTHNTHSGITARNQSERPAGVIEWTKEREDFFRQCGESMEKMILALDSIFTNEKKLLELANKGAGGLFLK